MSSAPAAHTALNPLRADHRAARLKPAGSFAIWPRSTIAVACLVLSTSGLPVSDALQSGIVLNALCVVALDMAATPAQRRSQLSGLSLFTWSHLLIFVLRPMRTSFHGVPNSVFGVGVDSSILLAGLNVGAAGAASVAAGSAFHRHLLGAHQRRPTATPIHIDGRTLRSITLLWLGYAIIAFSMFLGGPAGLTRLLAGRSQELTLLYESSSAILYAAPFCLIGVGLMWLLEAETKRDRRNGYLLIFVSQVPGLLSGSRSAILLAVLATAIAIRDRSTSRMRTSARIRWAMGGLVVIALFGVLREARTAEGRQQPASAYVETALTSFPSVVDGLLSTADTAMSEALGLEVKAIPSNFPFLGAKVYTNALLQVVPSELLQEKPVAADSHLSNLLLRNSQTGTTGFSFSIYGEAYLAAGIPSVLGFGLLTGVLINKLDRRRPAMTAADIPVIVLTAMIPIFFRGSIGADWLRALIALAPFLALRWARWISRAIGRSSAL